MFVWKDENKRKKRPGMVHLKKLEAFGNKSAAINHSGPNSSLFCRRGVHENKKKKRKAVVHFPRLEASVNFFDPGI